MTVIVEAVHTIKPLTDTVFDRWVEIYGELILPAFERNGYDLLGWFKRSGGRMGQDVLLFRYDSLTAMDQASRSLFADPAMGQAIAGPLSEFLVEEQTTQGVTVPYATEQRLEAALAAKPEKPRQFLQAVLEIKLRKQEDAYGVLAKLVDRLDSEGGGLVTAYQATSGPRERLTDIWAVDSAPDFSYQVGDPLGDLVAPLREFAPEESMYYLNPLPGSPLQ